MSPRGRAFLLGLALDSAAAHFPLVDGVSAGPLYATLDTALVVSDVTRSQATNRLGYCQYPYFWFKAEIPTAGYTLQIGGTVPVIERFEDTRVAAAVIGPGLPTDEISTLPAEIQSQIPAGMGVLTVPGHPDQGSADENGSCHFLEDPLSLAVYKPVTGASAHYSRFTDWATDRCFYAEEWGTPGSDMWIVQDKLHTLVEAGTHYLVYWAPGDQLLGPPTKTAKYGIVFGDEGQSEEFSGNADDPGECAQTTVDFYEMDCHEERPDIARWMERLGMGICEAFYGVATPNLYSCDVSVAPNAMDPGCNNACHNHAECAQSTACDICEGGAECAETCAWTHCGEGDPNMVQGPFINSEEHHAAHDHRALEEGHDHGGGDDHDHDDHDDDDDDDGHTFVVHPDSSCGDLGEAAAAQKSDDDDGADSRLAIIGAVLGGVVVVAALASVVYVMKSKKTAAPKTAAKAKGQADASGIDVTPEQATVVIESSK